jgi:branched-subunit amino acid transport protein
MTGWSVVIFLGVASIVIKAAGPVLLGGWTPPDWAKRVLVLVSPVVLAALVAVSVFSSGGHYLIDTKVIGLGAAIVALLMRAPLVVVVISAVAASVVARAVLG